MKKAFFLLSPTYPLDTVIEPAAQDTTTNTQTTHSNTYNVNSSCKYNAIISDVNNNNQVVLSMDEDE